MSSDINQIELPDSVTHINDDGIDYYIIGTAHVSQVSVDDVKNVIEIIQPDTVVVELCEARHEAINNPNKWESMNIFEVIKSGKGMFLMANLLLTSFQKKIGNKFGVKPGSEMIEAIKLAKQNGIELVLGDRNIQTTLKRTWAGFSFWQKLQISSSMLSSAFIGVDIKEDELENLKQKDVLTDVLNDLGKSYPVIRERLIHERDLFLMNSIAHCEGQKIVAVVGAGHVPGIKEHWKEEVDIEEISKIPPPSQTGKIIKWSIPALIIALFIYGFYKEELGWELIQIWVYVNGTLSALGALIALAHPITIITAFIAAPITSLNPLIGAGYVTGLLEAYLRKPKVSDFHGLQDDILSIKGVYKNRISRILLVFILSSLGSALGTWIAALGILKTIN